VSHNKSRSNYHDIGQEILTGVKPEVVIGGGYPAGSSCASPSSSTYLSAAAYDTVCKDPDYTVVTRAAGVEGGSALLDAAKKAAKDGKKLFGLFGGSGGNFEPPVPTDDGTAAVNRATIENPLLKDASLAALKVLSTNKNGFFLMIEQGDVDWANHANDYKWMIGTMWDLNETVKAVVDFVDRPGDDIHWWNTLVIVTADHANSYMRLAEGIKLRKGDLPEQEGSTYPGGEVTYGTKEHTNELVMLYAMGGGNLTKHLRKFEGSWHPCTRIIDNTQLFHAMTGAAGLNIPSSLTAIVERPVRCFTSFGDEN
jgi:alkaline phosphatase